MNAWYPKLNSKGQVIAGSGEVWLFDDYKGGNGRKIAGGWWPNYLFDDTVVYYTDNDWRIQNIDDPNNLIVKQEKVNLVLGGNGKILRQVIPHILFEGKQDNGRVPSLSLDGKNSIWVTPYAEEWTNVICNWHILTPPRQVASTSACNKAVVWTEFAGGGRRVFGSKDNLNIDELTVTFWEDARVFDGKSEPIVISILQDGIFVREWGQELGWRYYGVFNEPSGRFLNDLFVVVASENGILKYLEIDLNSAKVPVDTVPIPPEPEPIPPDPIPPVVKDYIELRTI